MRLKLKNKQYLLFSVGSLIIVGMVFILDIVLYLSHTFPPNIYLIREMSIVIAYFLLGYVIYHKEYTNIVHKLKTFFLSILGVFITVSIPRLFLNQNYLERITNLPVLISSVKSLLNSTFISFFATIFSFSVLFILRDLIYYRSKKGTRKLFSLTLLLLVAYVICTHFSGRFYETAGAFSEKTTVERILYGALLFFILLLSLRTAWVNYLNKRQKIAAFWGGILIFPGAIMLTRSATYQHIFYYSVTLGTFDLFVAHFLNVYIAIALISLLLHLPTASIFDRKMKQISSLHNLSQVINSVLDYDKVVTKITELVTNVLDCKYSWLELADGNSDRLVVASAKGLTNRDLETMNLNSHSGVSGWIIQNKRSILVNEVGKDARAKYLRDWKKDIGSLLGVPLLSQNQIMGILYAMKEDEFGFDHEDQQMLQAFANQATIAIENARLVEESLEKERLEQEMRVAHQTQMKLLPQRRPEIQGLDIDAICIAANEVGGDYYSFVELSPSRLGIVIADVSGKGISAAFYMAQLKGIIDAFSKIYESPKVLLQKLNRTLYDNIDRMSFVSLIYAVVDTNKKRLNFCRAGHCPVFYYSTRDKKVHTLVPAGIGVALDKGPIFDRTIEQIEICFNPGDIFVFYTDGLSEARNQNQEEFGEQHLQQIISQGNQLSAQELKTAIVDELRQFIGAARTYDDMSLLIVKIEETKEE